MTTQESPKGSSFPKALLYCPHPRIQLAWESRDTQGGVYAQSNYRVVIEDGILILSPQNLELEDTESWE